MKKWGLSLLHIIENIETERTKINPKITSKIPNGVCCKG
jgi:hypothetical protein